ncbi:MAG: hypothetical protein JNM43_04840 [Planctomycetaceae bacterium]|nr:hypothetical protein [Planctomycetaceae bacterium]
MSVSSETERLVGVLVDDVFPIVKQRPNDCVRITRELSSLSELKPLVDLCIANPEQVREIIGAAAVAQLLFFVRTAILADRNVSPLELRATKDLLSECFYRYAWIERYSQFHPLIDAEMVPKVLDFWKKDKGLLGGDFQSGSIINPMGRLMMISSLLLRDVTIIDRYWQIIQLVVDFVLGVDGSTESEHQLKKSLQELHREERKSIIDVLNS